MNKLKKLTGIIIIAGTSLFYCTYASADMPSISTLLKQVQSSGGGLSQPISSTKNDSSAVPINSVDSQQDSNTQNDSKEGGSQSSTLGDTPISQAAFLQTVRNMLPLTPQQVHSLRVLLDKTQRAANAYPGTPPRPTSSSVIVNLAPGSTPPVIRLRKGFVTSLVFLDSTGAPWPIAAYDIGDPKAFNVQWNRKSNTLLVQALDTYHTGNLAVILKGQNTPVMLTLMPGQSAVDYRVDLRVPGLGPDANPTLSDLPAAQNPKLLTFLNGIPPQGAQTLQVQGGSCQAWLFHKHIYLRTSLTVLSPSWLATMSSPDGTHVYEIPQTPVVLASDRGKITQLELQGFNSND